MGIAIIKEFMAFIVKVETIALCAMLTGYGIIFALRDNVNRRVRETLHEGGNDLLGVRLDIGQIVAFRQQVCA